MTSSAAVSFIQIPFNQLKQSLNPAELEENLYRVESVLVAVSTAIIALFLVKCK